MAQVGVDTVLGWNPDVFDEALLDAAEASGVGVLMPFELRPPGGTSTTRVSPVSMSFQ